MNKWYLLCHSASFKYFSLHAYIVDVVLGGTSKYMILKSRYWNSKWLEFCFHEKFPGNLLYCFCMLHIPVLSQIPVVTMSFFIKMLRTINA